MIPSNLYIELQSFVTNLWGSSKNDVINIGDYSLRSCPRPSPWLSKLAQNLESEFKERKIVQELENENQEWLRILLNQMQLQKNQHGPGSINGDNQNGLLHRIVFLEIRPTMRR